MVNGKWTWKKRGNSAPLNKGQELSFQYPEFRFFFSSLFALWGNWEKGPCLSLQSEKQVERDPNFQCGRSSMVPIKGLSKTTFFEQRGLLSGLRRKDHIFSGREKTILKKSQSLAWAITNGPPKRSAENDVFEKWGLFRKMTFFWGFAGGAIPFPAEWKEMPKKTSKLKWRQMARTMFSKTITGKNFPVQLGLLSLTQFLLFFLLPRCTRHLLLLFLF